jgi:outer membrane protein OmpA-like peptidoglycan-associated protein
MGWPVNFTAGTYDRNKVNFLPAPNDDYTEAGKFYISGQKVSLQIVENGKYTGKDTSMAATGVASWFPVDQVICQQKGGLVKIASTREYASQMPCGIIVIKKWADDNRPTVEKLIEAFGRGGDQVKSHDEALQFASQVNEVVFADKEKDAQAWYNGYKSFDLTDDDGNVMNIGGSRVFNIADAAAYVGLTGGTDKYRTVYNTFGNICKEAYPEVLGDFPSYEDATDWSFLRAVYNKTKGQGTAGNVSTTDFSTSTKGGIIGDANYSIEFNTGSAIIKPESYATLNKISDLLSTASNAFVEIAGHTDNTGDPGKNQTLSEARAQSVKDYIAKKDPDMLSPGKMNSKGYGETVPIADNTTAAGKAKNRRVEIKLFKAK